MDASFAGYRLGKQIAEGGMCDVFLAKRVKDNRKVVVKLMRVTDVKSAQRVIREQRLLQEIEHPNVVKVLDTGCLEIRPYLILEFVAGSSLRELIERKGAISFEETKTIVKQVASALGALHDKEIVHRDVKPENILLEPGGNVKLIDLSIGAKLKELGSLTDHNEYVGTTDYMSPEQRSAERVDDRTDQFALAAVTFEMLTGQQAIGQFQRPSEINQNLDQKVDKVLVKAMSRDPEDRYDSVEDFFDALNHLSPNPTFGTPKKSTLMSAAVAFLLPIAAYFVFLSFINRSGVEMTEGTATRNEAVSGHPADDVAKDTGQLERVTNSIGMNFVLVPGGQFEFGTSSEQLEELFGDHIPHPYRSESPSRHVIINQSFWMGTSEVSVEHFRAFVDDTGYQTTSERWAEQMGRHLRQPIWNDPVHFKSQDDLPAIAISWEDANRFCEWLSKKEGVTYRLPTEVEWEYACRAGSKGPWSCDERELAKHATYGRRWVMGPGVVGLNNPNPWGIHDMHGNVWEWCQEEFVSVHENPFPNDDAHDQRELLHVVRGGGYKAPPQTIRSSSRRGFSDRQPLTDLGHGIGFRVVREATQLSRRPSKIR